MVPRLALFAKDYPTLPGICETWLFVRHSTVTRLGRCHIDYFLFFGSHVITIYGALVISDQRHRMIADEFPGNRNTSA